LKLNIEYVPAGIEGYGNRLDFTKIDTNYMLLNASYLKLDDKFYRLRDNIRAAGKKTLIDSGGFQLATGAKKDLEVKDIINIQNEIADIGFMLDVPPLAQAGEVNDNVFFNKCLEASYQNVLKAKNLEKKFNYYLIVQGMTYEQQKRWYDKLHPVDTFDGISTKGTVLEQLLMGLFFVHETDYKSHHILGVSSLPNMVLINYFYNTVNKDMKLITFDSTTALVNSMNKNLIIPFVTQQLSLSKYTEFCDVGGYTFEELKTNYCKFLQLNIKQLNYQNKMINSIVKNKEELVTLIPKVKDYIEVIDYYNDNGLGKTLEKYKLLFNISNYIKTNQKSVFDF